MTLASPLASLFLWGSSEDGQLGLGGIEIGQITMPTLFNPKETPSSIFEAGISKVACGYKHTLLLTKYGEVFSCGSNEFRQLGHDYLTTKFEQVSFLIDTCFCLNSTQLRLFTYTSTSVAIVPFCLLCGNCNT
ncbi:unnamed protein product [Protopolystoma xenopodis]|uniref:Uncharacterized protein n=1 Tax=Protopolystoma xenopodis TaxID=117903 RepID=A0A448WTK6_9PLAT|nr:unnamed protein product [Protopolystoma xenopodis]